MKRRNCFVVLLLLILSLLSWSMIELVKNDSHSENDNLKIVTSFYPMYIAALNVVDGVEGISVQNMTEPQTGCLHDYQMTPNDMVSLSQSDGFIINGQGIEGFLSEVLNQYPDLPIITASEGITMLESGATDHVHEEEADDHVHEEDDHDHVHEEEDDHVHAEETDGHDHGGYNAHVWTSPEKYMQEVDNIVAGLSKLDPAHEKEYTENGEAYKTKIAALQAEAQSIQEQSSATNVILFHEAFAYLASEYGFGVVEMIDMDENTSLSANQLAALLTSMKEHEVHILFAEEAYGEAIANAIAAESDGKVFILDSMLRGDGSKDSYLQAMRKNLEVIKEALKWKN